MIHYLVFSVSSRRLRPACGASPEQANGTTVQAKVTCPACKEKMNR